MTDLKIGLALSGGGVRAAVFHLGVLRRLAELGMLEQVTDISTVSGASLVIGLVFSKNNLRWPTSTEFIHDILPQIKDVLTTKDLQLRAIWTLLLHPWWIRDRAKILSKEIHKYWGVRGKVNRLPDDPRWIINATTFETGKNWRFTNVRMGDYVCGYVFKPNIPLSAAMASSASLPFLIGPYSLKAHRYLWFQYDDPDMAGAYERPAHAVKAPFKRIHLWDGGVFENLGIEALFRDDKLREDIDYLIVSDASAPIKNKRRSSLLLVNNLLRLINIAVNQVRSILARDFLVFLDNNPGAGLYLKLGHTASRIMESANPASGIHSGGFLNDAQVDKVKYYKTTLRKLSNADFELIQRHGYEVMCAAKACQDAKQRSADPIAAVVPYLGVQGG